MLCVCVWSQQTGSYMVRDCKNGGPQSPYSLSVVYNKFIYHMLIRIRPDQKYAVGREKTGETVRSPNWEHFILNWINIPYKYNLYPFRFPTDPFPSDMIRWILHQILTYSINVASFFSIITAALCYTSSFKILSVSASLSFRKIRWLYRYRSV